MLHRCGLEGGVERSASSLSGGNARVLVLKAGWWSLVQQCTLKISRFNGQNNIKTWTFGQLEMVIISSRAIVIH